MPDRSRNPLATWPAQDLDWAQRTELELALRGAGATGIARVLADARHHLDDAGAPARDLFGDPGEYADERLDDALSDVDRVDADLLAPGPRRWLSWWLAAAGVQLALVAAADLLGLGFDGRLLVLGAVLALATGALTGAWALLENGRPAPAAGAGVLAAGIVAAGAWALTSGWAGPVVPAALVLIAGVALAGVGAALTRSRRALPAPPATREAWLARLRGLLVGRHLFTPGEAQSAVEDVAGHAARPDVEFGHPEVYAHVLARQAGRTGPRRARLRTAGLLVGAAVLLALGLSGLAESGPGALPLALCAAGAALGASAWRDPRRTGV